MSKLKERTFSTVKESRGPASERAAEESFFRSKFTALGACATEGMGGVRAESNLEKN